MLSRRGAASGGDVRWIADAVAEDPRWNRMNHSARPVRTPRRLAPRTRRAPCVAVALVVRESARRRSGAARCCCRRARRVPEVAAAVDAAVADVVAVAGNPVRSARRRREAAARRAIPRAGGLPACRDLVAHLSRPVPLALAEAAAAELTSVEGAIPAAGFGMANEVPFPQRTLFFLPTFSRFLLFLNQCVDIYYS